MQLDRTNRFLLATTALLAIATLIRLGQSVQAPEPMWSTTEVTDSEVRGITFKKPDGAVELERSGMGWRMTAPAAFPVEAQKVVALLRDWQEPFAPDLKLADSVSDDDLATYGLDEAQRTEFALLAASGPLVELHIGKSIAGGSHYLRRPNDRGVYRGRVPGVLRLKTGKDAWRDMTVLAIDEDSIISLQLSNSDGEFHFVRSPTSPGQQPEWQARAPEGLRVAQRSLDSMAKSLSKLKATKFLEGKEAEAGLARASLDNPRVTVRVGSKEEGGDQHTLRFGADEQANSTVFAQVEGQDSLLVLSVASLKQFDKSKKDLQDRTVLSLDREAGVEVRFIEGEHTVVAKPDGARDWKVLEPSGVDSNNTELKLAMNSLVNMQAVELQSDSERAETGPDSPRIEIKGPKGSQILRIGSGPRDGKYLGTVDGRTELFVLRGTVVERLLKVFRALKP
ncbi:MAG TPA: hypothetical protein DIU15_12475 [Deltaproteobacteria bacterium]|nr:hypothetical protein [Deltaproteobacteria bacterium]HCP46853.1 hypothetical protein [Deltaproteobacteria bacterium]